MIGDEKRKTNQLEDCESEKGILFLSIEELLARIDQDKEKNYSIKCSNFEIYNE
jgi:hypothetical protein